MAQLRSQMQSVDLDITKDQGTASQADQTEQTPQPAAAQLAADPGQPVSEQHQQSQSSQPSQQEQSSEAPSQPPAAEPGSRIQLVRTYLAMNDVEGAMQLLDSAIADGTPEEQQAAMAEKARIQAEMGSQ